MEWFFIEWKPFVELTASSCALMVAGRGRTFIVQTVATSAFRVPPSGQAVWMWLIARSWTVGTTALNVFNITRGENRKAKLVSFIDDCSFRVTQTFALGGQDDRNISDRSQVRRSFPLWSSIYFRYALVLRREAL